MDVEKLCPGCMRERQSMEGPCPFCGYDASAAQVEAHQLPPGTILSGKYLVGKLLGEGGFGITYLGWDLNLDMKVAIKEYYPAGFVMRENTSSNTVLSFTGEKGEFYQAGKDKFLSEAKSLAKFFLLPGIVCVKDFFLENNTAYIVMEYIDGVTLKTKLAQSGGKMPVGPLLELMRPLMSSLSTVHKAGLIHRDISPDNIMVSNAGQVKLLDFGAARDVTVNGGKSLAVVLKPGYAPEEQYRTQGQQGPWTDVYALCATIYKCITGVTPPEPIERMANDKLVPPIALCPVTPAQNAALLKGLAIYAAQRFQSIEELYRALYGSPVSQTPPPTGAAMPTGAGVNGGQQVNPAVNQQQEQERQARERAAQEEAARRQAAMAAAQQQQAEAKAKRNRILLVAGIAVAALLIIILLASQSCGSSAGSDSSSSSSRAETVSSQVSESQPAGFSQGRYQDNDIGFSYSEDWLPSTAQNGGPCLTGILGGVEYEFTVLDITDDTAQDINDYLADAYDYLESTYGITPVAGGTGSLSNGTVGSYSARVTGCLYEDGGEVCSLNLYIVTDGAKRVAIMTRAPGLSSDSTQYDGSVFDSIFDSFEIYRSASGGGQESSAAASSAENVDALAEILYDQAQSMWSAGQKEEAVEYFMQAAESGYAPAQNTVGYLYEKGDTLEKDMDEALYWYEEAANQGYAMAQHNLGVLYREGDGVEQDYELSFEWLTKAAEQGYADSQNDVGYAYQYGLGVSKDLEKAFEWYMKAAEQGSDIGQCNVGICYRDGIGVEQDYDEAFQWLLKAAEQGFASAQNDVGFAYQNGQGVEEDMAEAFDWYMKAAEQGFSVGQYNVGICYKMGRGVEQDYEEALAWFKMAADQGSEDAQNQIDSYEQLGGWDS